MYLEIVNNERIFGVPFRGVLGHGVFEIPEGADPRSDPVLL